MRPITKILLLVLIAFAVYLLFPRTPDLSGFDAKQLAELKIEAWQAQKREKGFDALVDRYKVYASQFRFDPISAFRIAQSQGAALKNFELSQVDNSDPVTETRTLSSLTEKYTWIKKQTNLPYNADAMAREEFSWRVLEHENAPPEEVAGPLSRVFAGLYGGAPEDFLDVAIDVATARALVLREGYYADEEDPVGAAKERLVEAYALLKEIAKTPVTAGPAEP